MSALLAPDWETALALHAAATWFMTGLIWIVQLVHYPLFVAVEPALFPAFASEHARRITWIVAPAMAAEALSALALLGRLPDGGPDGLVIAGLALLVVVWVSTAALQMPCHARLAQGYDAQVHARLVRGNWLRTLAWSARAVIASLLLAA